MFDNIVDDFIETHLNDHNSIENKVNNVKIY